MGQVPELGLVGSGRVARHFHHYLHLLGVPVRGWTRHDPDRPPEAFHACRTVLLLIKDEAILPFIHEWPGLREKHLVHFSGSLTTALADAAHPLMTVGTQLYDLQCYRQIPFVLEAGRTPFDQLLPELPNPSFTIPAGQRPYYHALCVMAGNFSTLLWQKLFDELEGRFGIPAAAAHPYMFRVAANLASDAGRALTGPLSRGDAATIAANIDALAGDPFQAVYAAFVKAHEHRS
jgi:hypothetical protein